jgi:DNA-binding MarR family transcriptional regulator
MLGKRRLETVGTPARPMDIARHLGLTSGAASTIVKRLVGQGFVTRHLNPTDGRGQVIHLTTRVRDAMRRAAGGSDLGALGQIMTLSERESRRVVRLLSTVTAGFTDGARDDPDVESAALRSMGDTSP